MKIYAVDEDSLLQSLAVSRLALFGSAILLLTSNEYYYKRSFNLIVNHVLLSIRHKQLKCYVNPLGKVVGVMIWAWVTPTVLDRLERIGKWPPTLHESEWKEGDIFLVLDVVSKDRSLRKIINDVVVSADGASRISWFNVRRRRLCNIPMRRIHL